MEDDITQLADLKEGQRIKIGNLNYFLVTELFTQ